LGAPAFAGASLVALTLTAAASPTGFFGTIYLQRMLGLPPTTTGLAFLPFTLAVIAGSFFGSRLAGKVGTRTTMVLGMCFLAAGMLLYSGISAEGGYLAHLLPSFVVVGSGLGLASVGSTIAGTSAVAGNAQGLVSGILNTAAQLGTALGLAALVTVASARTDALTGGADPSPSALVEGFRWAFLGGAGVGVLGALVAFFLVRERGGRRRAGS
jgi:MFS family permease